MLPFHLDFFIIPYSLYSHFRIALHVCKGGKDVIDDMA